MAKFLNLRRVVAFCVLCGSAAIASQAQTFTTLASFDGTNGVEPFFGPLVQGTDGNFYGTTAAGGANDLGTVFKMTPAGVLTTIYSFCAQAFCADGDQPLAGLVLGTDGNFYGTTSRGPVNCQGCQGYGTVFRVTPAGVLTVLHSFNLRDGAYSYAPLAEGADGSFYGTTAAGGAYGDGTIFKVTYAGRFTSLHSFDSTDGDRPLAPLLEAADGNFYGTTNGGANDFGTIFKITPSGALSTFYSFCPEIGCVDGTGSSAGLVIGNDGDFYGTTPGGGTGAGTVFKITPSGALTTLHAFDDTDGATPSTTLIQATDGNLYGTTPAWGTEQHGTIFEITPGGTLTTLYNFCFDDNCADSGGTSFAALVQGTGGELYGETYGGGTENDGVIFSLDIGLGPTLNTLPAAGSVGATVRILGTNLSGATAVSFNGTPASFTVVTRSLIKTSVPVGATTGRVQVTTPSGTLTSNAVFPVIP
jgi:uncharacterized repeat protein (TIGR03803 family)